MIVPWDNPAKEAAYFQPRALTSPTLVRRIFVDDMLAKPETWTFKPRTAVVTDLIQTFNTTQTLYQEQLAAIKTAIGAEGVEIPPESIVLDLDQQTKQKLIADIRWYTEKRQATLDGIATLEDQEKPVDFEEELPRMKAAYLAAERAELYPPVK
jgi:hypothetical protein